MTDRNLFELEYAPTWGYSEEHFFDNEHRYTKMHRLLRELGADLASARILDLGCCRGQLLARFAQYPDVRLGGVEIDDEEIRLAREHGFVEPVRHSINALRDDGVEARLPEEDDSLDVVLAGEIIEHMVDTQGFLEEIIRVLRAGGALVLSTPNLLWWKYRVQMLAGRHPDCVEERLRYGEDLGHVRVFTAGRLASLLEETGFRDVQLRGLRLGPLASLSKTPAPVAHALAGMADRLPALSNTLIAFARKP